MKLPKLITRIIIGTVGAVLAIMLSHSFLANTPFWKDSFLDEFLIVAPGFAFGFWIVPWLATRALRWFVNLVTVTVQVTVARTMGSFLAAQSRLSSQRRLEQEAKKSARSNKDMAAKLLRSVPPIVLDTSAVIDGRFPEIIRAGFVPNLIILPRPVIDELQQLADSEDELRRQKGRRGLDLLNQLRKDKKIKIQVWTEPVEGGDVDGKLTNLAKNLKASVATVDYNLNKSLSLLSIPVLNVNELVNLVKTVILPGETLSLKIIQKGKEPRQGVGYLSDGTMIVVEEGESFLGKEASVKVSRLLQTPAGKMIFAKIIDGK